MSKYSTNVLSALGYILCYDEYMRLPPTQTLNTEAKRSTEARMKTRQNPTAAKKQEVPGMKYPTKPDTLANRTETRLVPLYLNTQFSPIYFP